MTGLEPRAPGIEEADTDWGNAEQATTPTRAPTIPERQEDARRTLAYMLVGLFLAEVAFILAGIAFGFLTLDTAKELGGLIVTPTVALASAATGFYFGAKR